MTDATEAGLLRGICEHPADDDRRLVMADWLDDHGQPERAEFVRVQIERERFVGCNFSTVDTCEERRFGEGDVTGCKRCATRVTLRRRERQLLKSNVGAWTNFLPEEVITAVCPYCCDRSPDWETNVVECRHCESTGVVADYDRVSFRRGFVAEVRLPLETFIGRECQRRWTHNRDAQGSRHPVHCECQGTGRIDAHGPLLVRRCPLEFVEVSNKEAYTSSGIYQWSRAHTEQGQKDVCESWLPSMVYDLLPYRQNHIGTQYKTQVAAKDALSQALIAWAWKQEEPT